MIRFIDCHAHVYRRPVPFVTQFCSPEELLLRYDQDHIEMGALLPIVNNEVYFPQANEDILDIVTNRPDRFFAFCNVDPRILTNRSDAPIGKVLEYYKAQGCKGIGEIMPNLSLMDPRVQNLLKHAEAVGLPVTLDGSDQLQGDFGLFDEVGMPFFEHSLQRFPKLDFIGHGMTFWSELGKLVRPAMRKTTFQADGIQVGWVVDSTPIDEEGIVPQLFRVYSNLYGELSDAYWQLARDPEFGANFLTEFSDRLFFGTDICSFAHDFLTQKLLTKWHQEKRISETVFRKIARENAIHYYQLPVAL